MARYQRGDEDMREFARWLVVNFPVRFAPVVKAFWDLKKTYEWSMFDDAIREVAGPYAKRTEGAVVMTRREHYRAAADTVADMLTSGELKLRIDLWGGSGDDAVVITGPGDYITRDGRRVTIHTISQGPETCPAKGAIWKMFRGKERPRGYDIWQLNGRSKFVGESPSDIVGPWATDQGVGEKSVS